MFSFVIHPGKSVATALRFKVDGLVGATLFQSFPVDLVVDLTMIGVPDVMLPSLPEIDGMERVPYRVYPVGDHIADKVCAMHEFHNRDGDLPVPSSRYRDLVDLVLIARESVVDAGHVTLAVRSEASRRRLRLPARLAVPQGDDWRSGYARIARAVPQLRETEFDVAVAIVQAFLNPVLDGTARGRWNPSGLRWES